MRNILRKMAVTEITEVDQLANYENEDAQEELDRADEAWERLIESLAGSIPELKGQLQEESNEVRTHAMFGGYEAGMRMGAQLIYELLIKEGGIA